MSNEAEVKTLNIFKIDENRSFTESEAYNLVNMLHIVTTKAKNKINSYGA